VLESTASSQVRIATLRKRWEADRGSSAFLPLAEEYRRLGRFRDAIDTLEAGLRMQPSYLSAQVALGRCLLESGDAPGAGLVLERVLATDPTQLVANKLLVEAHLRAGQATQALGRLDAYTALNDRDPDVPGLRQRIFKALQREPPPLAPPRRGQHGPTGELPGIAAQSDPRADAGDSEPLFELHGEGEAAPDLSSLWSADEERDQGFGAESGLAEPWPAESGNGDELFAGLGGAAAHTRYLAALFGEGLFARVADRTEPASWTPEPETPLPAPVPAAAPEATVTLGELYRSQGHLGDAAQIFSAVLDREPDNAAAQDGLALTEAAGAVAPAVPAPLLAEGVTARKIRALRGYLQGFRRGASHHVP
jgi:tetratricopeptide (TPR) repeat protein